MDRGLYFVVLFIFRFPMAAHMLERDILFAHF